MGWYSSHYAKSYLQSNDLRGFQIMLDRFDTNKDGKLQFEEFLQMATQLGQTPETISLVKRKFFPYFGALNEEKFTELCLYLFDLNQDGVLQVEEVSKVVRSLGATKEQVKLLEKKYFPTNTEQYLYEHKFFNSLMNEISNQPERKKSPYAVGSDFNESVYA